MQWLGLEESSQQVSLHALQMVQIPRNPEQDRVEQGLLENLGNVNTQAPEASSVALFWLPAPPAPGEGLCCTP
jgi:hypothetical protein